MKPRFLMCSPTHYAIEYEINPWMKLRNGAERAKAAAQWERLRGNLASLGARIETLPQRKGCPDMVFTANAGVVAGDTFFPSHFRYKERQGEESAFIQFFRRQGYRIKDVAKGLFFEGEGDMLPFNDWLVGGFRFRSEIAALERVAGALKKRLVAVELFTPRFYHLDTCFLPLDDKHALYFPGAFDRYGRRAIEQFVPQPIPVSRADAFEFACNGIRIGKTVVVNRASRSLKQQIKNVGYQVVESPTSEFMKAGGSVKCLLLRM